MTTGVAPLSPAIDETTGYRFHRECRSGICDRLSVIFELLASFGPSELTPRRRCKWHSCPMASKRTAGPAFPTTTERG